MKVFDEMFGVKIPIIGVVHLPPLPGAPMYTGMSVKKITEKAVSIAKLLVENGVNGLVIENFGDKEFQKRVGPEVIAALSVISKEVKDVVKVPIGLCVLQADVFAALAISKAIDAEFIRAAYFTEVAINDLGFMEGCAGEALRYRKYIESKTKIFVDVHVKHSYPLMQRPIEESAEDAVERGLADAITITGRKTGGETNIKDVIRVREALKDVPLIVGSGVTINNVDQYLDYVNAIIVATSFNFDGTVEGELDQERISAFMKKINDYRKNKNF
ncbi:MAG: BtpA/SgcQ family protein [Candidatus Methanofastidiosa archaeon]|nr:BtpA/SgcQ family protein [Candidatus Methanofastidiosa archaeon]